MSPPLANQQQMAMQQSELQRRGRRDRRERGRRLLKGHAVRNVHMRLTRPSDEPRPRLFLKSSDSDSDF